jgi:Reverse transcriptase (RNA-dependent DNA polymerase)
VRSSSSSLALPDAAKRLNEFINGNRLSRCDVLLNCRCATYVNLPLNCSSHLDYFLTSDTSCVRQMKVIDEGSNLSDHLPVIIDCCFDYNENQPEDRTNECPRQKYLRWDRADLNSYYAITGREIQATIRDLLSTECVLSGTMPRSDATVLIENVYCRIVKVLSRAAMTTVPNKYKNYYKFWWDQELSLLKEKSINDHKLWIAAGRPRCGPIACNARISKLAYKKRIKEQQQKELLSYNKDMHEALISKHGSQFWRCWKSRFNSRSVHLGQVDGNSDNSIVANLFLEHFSKSCSPATNTGNKRLYEEYAARRTNYSGIPWDDSYMFDVELVDSAIRSLKQGKAAGPDGLSAEHLQRSHPALAFLLTKMFNLMITYSYVPSGFRMSYIIPLLKDKSCGRLKQLTVEDFRGVSISCVVSKVFEKCILDRYRNFFNTSDNQFGFKPGSSCASAIYTVRCVVDYYTKQGGTVNMCALDLRKAFDKMNHWGLYIKLMDRMLPNRLLSTLEFWFELCLSCVRWGNTYSAYAKFVCGVRQGGVLSPYLFAIYMDDVVKLIRGSSFGCYVGMINVSIILYADDIFILAPSVTALQKLISLCESYLRDVDMMLNSTKSVCIRMGVGFNKYCAAIKTASGSLLPWVGCCRYLGVYLVAAKRFKVSFDINRKSYYRAVNNILCKIGGVATEDVLVKLLVSKCVPILMYGSEVSVFNNTLARSLDFLGVRLSMKIFRTNSIVVVRECMVNLPQLDFVNCFRKRKEHFLTGYMTNENLLCNIFCECAKAELSKLRAMSM